MIRPTYLLAGTAVGLLIAAGHAYAAAPASAHPTLFPVERSVDPIVTGPVPITRAPVVLAQATDEEDEEQEGEQKPAEDTPQENAPEAPAAETPAEAPAAQEPPAEAPAAEEPAAEEPAPEPEAPAATEEPAAEPQAETPPADAPAAAPEPAEEAETPGEAPAPSSPDEPQPEAPAAQDEPAPAQDEAPAEPQPEAPATEAPADAAPEAPADAPADASPEAPAETNPEAPADAAPAEPAAPGAGTGDSQASPLPENAAPVLDSAKEEPAADGGGTADTAQPAAPAAPAGPPPASDAAAQAEAQPAEIQAVRAEEGRRVERAPDRQRRERPDDAQVVGEIGDRIVIQIDNRTFVQGDDRRRMSRDASDVYYEELRNGRTRETVVRPNGSMVVTVRDRYGDIVQRSRITPDGREYVLVYRDDRDDRRRGWRDPGRDLPPLRLTIPVSEYILDARRTRGEQEYYDFLRQPPIERVERLYGLDEVQRSARIRDKARRVDLDNITFDFGSATIAESEIRKIEGLADAMLQLVEENPAETFLIEGHTDAVGSENANLALSDRRAEALAIALTDVFGIPPENLATQGYGETYLKVDTQEPERLNRRVAVRRITPLVAPVASAN